MESKTINPIKKSSTEIDAPSSKAHTLRALIISALAQGESTISKPLLAEDQINVINALKNLGIKIQQQENKIIIQGSEGKINPTSDNISVGDSGVGMNFLTAIAPLSNKEIIIQGTERLNQRPVKQIVEGLRQLGAKIEYIEKEGFPPLKISPSKLKGTMIQICGDKTSQYFSAISIVAPLTKDSTEIICIDKMREKPYIDITLEMMQKFGVTSTNENYKKISIPENQNYKAQNIEIEGDFSSAAFYFLIAAITKTKVKVNNLNINSKQGDKEFIDILKKMNCQITKETNSITIKGDILSSIEHDMQDIPDLVPATAIACAFANGTSKLKNISHLVHKESNRVQAMIEGLKKMGIRSYIDDEDFIIKGSNNIHEATIDPKNDHRIAMSFAIAGLNLNNQIILNPKCVAKSFPDFWEKLEIFTNE